MTPLSDAAAREAIARDLDATMVVEAAAGTGKTTELVRRIIAVLAAGRGAIDGLVAVTFTEKAAGELKLRLRAELENARQAAAAGTPARAHLERALARLEEARVGTIHGLCADLLRERPIEAGVDPLFRVLPEGEAERLFRATFARWLQEQMHDPPEGLRRSLRRQSRGGDDGPSERLLRAAWQLAAWRHFDADWRRPPFDRAAAVDALVARLADFAALTEHCASPRSDLLYRDTAPARRLRDAVARAEAVRPRDHDGLEAALVDLAADRDFRRARAGRGTFYFKEITRAAVREAHAELVAALDAFRRDADADLAAAIRAELRDALGRYEVAKTRAGALDFLDLLLRARALLRDVAVVRADFQRRCTHLFVDEFQDTDPLQAEILLLLAADEPAASDWRTIRPAAGKLFLVGDPKQSIYRFRGADVGVYLDVKERLAAAGARCVELTTSFRATPSIQAFVNAAFAPQLRADPQALQADYVALAPAREEVAGRPTVIALPVPRPYGGNDKIAKVAIDRSLPDAVAAYLEWLVRDSGWTVTERQRPGVPVPLAERHVCLLFRRFDSFFAGDITRGYVRALEARGIPHLLVGGKSFHVREEVETMRAALAAVEWPEDELSLYATLRGSLFAVPDEALFVYRQTHGALHPFRIPAELPEPLAPIGAALALLGELHRGRNRRPVADTIARLLDATRAHAGFVLRPSGEQALANVLHVAELARTYEIDGGISFRGFVERLQEEAERAQTAEAPILEEGSDGVRLMTVHRAKGLEFPVVVLADITCGLTGAVGRHVDPARGVCALRIGGWAPSELLEHEPLEAARDAAEAVRVAYVAATRARDLLVVPAVGDGPFDDGWIGGLNPALYPADRRAAAPAPGCPSFGRDSVIERPPELAFDADPVRPGRHPRDGYDVTWWDPSLLRLGVAARFGIRQEELLGKTAPRAVVEAGLRRVAAWQAEHDTAVARGTAPSCSVRTATARAAEAGAEAPDVELVELPRADGRPAGPRFGALVHAVLALAPLAAAPREIEAVAAVQARVLGAPAAETAAAVAAVTAALAHPLLRAAAAAALLRRETPLSLLDDDGTLVEGVVDLAFRDEHGWTVVDYKTDQELAARADVYRRQVALYARALTIATSAPARAILLRV